MVASAAMLGEEDLLAGLELIHRDTHGRYSLSDRVGLKAKALHGTTQGLVAQLGLTPAEVLAWRYEPRYHLRPAQRSPEAFNRVWRTWFLLGGRGAGKTHAGSVGVLEEARQDPDARILIVGPTWSEIRKTQLEGPSGILTLAPPWFQPEFKVSKKELHFPNGAVAFCVPAQSAAKFRGYNCSFGWADEIVAWKKEPIEIYKECRRVLRIVTPRMRAKGLPARLCITTTPAPTELFRIILGAEDRKEREGLILARSTTLDNASNLDPQYLRMALRLLNTTEGKREYGGELFFALDATLYRRVNWEASRVRNVESIPERKGEKFKGLPLFDKVVISVDPATGEKKSSDLHGIVVVGIREEDDGLLHTYVLQDLSLQAPEPSAYARAAVKAYHAWKEYAPPKKTWIFAETNTGGSHVKAVIRAEDATVRVKTQRAQNSKAERASPVSMLAEAGLVHMMGKHHRLEEQLAKFTGAEGGHGRDDRADAFAWPIYLYVVPKRQMRGAAGTAGPPQEQDEEEDE
jgi:phage terminase large subunit-like protein